MKVRTMDKKVHEMRDTGNIDSGQLRNTFKASSNLSTPGIEAVVRHLARLAAEHDYGVFIATGKIPYADPKPGGN